MTTQGERLKTIRIKLNLTQQDIANELGITNQSVGKAEKDINRLSNESLSRLLGAFRVNINYILSGRGEMFITESAPDADFKQNVKIEVKEMLLEYGLIDAEK